MPDPSPEAFMRESLRRIARGETLSDDDARTFAALLDAREAAGRPLLGQYAGTDPSMDTVSGRCGLRPRFTDIE